MIQAKNGSTVKVRYKGRIENAEGFDTSNSREPHEFTIGRGDAILGLEKGVIGMKALQFRQKRHMGHGKKI